eukprot:scaffold6587_cov103-Isochrysis_galbana.AAC.11
MEMILGAPLAGVLVPLAPPALTALSLPLLRLLPAPAEVTAGVTNELAHEEEPMLVLLSCQTIAALPTTFAEPSVPLPTLFLDRSPKRPSGGMAGAAAAGVVGRGTKSDSGRPLAPAPALVSTPPSLGRQTEAVMCAVPLAPRALGLAPNRGLGAAEPLRRPGRAAAPLALRRLSMTKTQRTSSSTPHTAPAPAPVKMPMGKPSELGRTGAKGGGGGGAGGGSDAGGGGSDDGCGGGCGEGCGGVAGGDGDSNGACVMSYWISASSTLRIEPSYCTPSHTPSARLSSAWISAAAAAFSASMVMRWSVPTTWRRRAPTDRCRPASPDRCRRRLDSDRTRTWTWAADSTVVDASATAWATCVW